MIESTPKHENPAVLPEAGAKAVPSEPVSQAGVSCAPAPPPLPAAPVRAPAEDLAMQVSQWKQPSGKNSPSSLKSALEVLCRRGDALSLNTVRYVMDAINTGQLEIEKADLDQNTGARASVYREKFLVRFSRNTKWSSFEQVATVLVHEINHIKNEVRDRIVFAEDPFRQFVTEFRAYLVAGNWPAPTKKEGGVDVFDKTVDDEFKRVRADFLAGNTQRLREDEDVRRKLAAHITNHVYDNYQHANVMSFEPTKKQVGFAEHFISKGVLDPAFAGNTTNA